MKDFAAIDFETANNERSSVCSVGVVIVRNGEIADSFYSLIQPKPNYYNYWCSQVHGLCHEDTEEAPVFPKVWAQIEPLIEGLPLVAHNKPFDEGCLKAVFRAYQMDYPDYEFHDTLCVSRRVLPHLENHQLHTVAAACGYYLENHHHALADAEACAWIAKEILQNKLNTKLNMNGKTIDPVAIRELIGMDFFIPSYQRGYRWTTQQVKELLEDIEDFCTKETNGIYCIQPLVVKKNGTNWDVIDGQQRLTTINIILSCLGQKNFKLKYATRPQSQSFLRDILNHTDKEALENIDFYHMIEARNYILHWKQGKSDDYIKYFTKVLLDKVKFIWYDTDTQDPIEVFTRLNIDKIPLTSAELIKAILLNRSNFDSEGNFERVRLFQQDIASQWNEMEAMLQNDVFWLFFHDDAGTPETRIDYIFDLMCSQCVLGEPSEEIGTDQSHVFRYFYDYFRREKYSQVTLKRVWEEVKKIYNTLYEWFTHLELYHYVGYLMARPKESTRQKGNPVSQQTLLFKYLKEWNKPGMTIGKFREYLIGEINTTLNDCCDLGNVYEKKGKPKTQCRPLLLLHNIESVIQQGKIIQQEYGQSVFSKFPFNLYKKEKWDVEHIDSNTTNDLTDFNEQKEWLLTCYVFASKEQREEIQGFCKMQDIDDDNKRKRRFDKLVQDIRPNGNVEKFLNEDEKNMVWNFTLLDENTNRSYGNAIFPAKRRIIIGKEQGVYYPVPTFNKEKGFERPEERRAKSAFIPPCTKQAFMKYYSPTSGCMVAWTRTDAEAYLKNIYHILSTKFKVKDYVPDTI